MTDSIIHEVRAVREQHAASFDFDLDRIFADLQARQIKHAAEGWTIIPAPASPPPTSNLALHIDPMQPRTAVTAVRCGKLIIVKHLPHRRSV